MTPTTLPRPDSIRTNGKRALKIIIIISSCLHITTFKYHCSYLTLNWSTWIKSPVHIGLWNIFSHTLLKIYTCSKLKSAGRMSRKRGHKMLIRFYIHSFRIAYVVFFFPEGAGIYTTGFKPDQHLSATDGTPNSQPIETINVNWWNIARKKRPRSRPSVVRYCQQCSYLFKIDHYFGQIIF